MFAPPERCRSWLRNMDNRNVSILGERSGIGEGFRVKPVPFGIEQEDRRRHLYIVGKTGVGKSTLLQNLILQDIEEGRGFALLDPLGDLAEELLDYIPPRRTDHVVYFSPADTDFPVAFNLLADVGLQTLRRRTHYLARYARRRLVQLAGIPPATPDSDEWYGCMASVPLPGGDAWQLQDKLWRQHRIEVPIVEHNGQRSIRVSCHLYNTRDQIDTLVNAMEVLLRDEQ